MLVVQPELQIIDINDFEQIEILLKGSLLYRISLVGLYRLSYGQASKGVLGIYCDGVVDSYHVLKNDAAMAAEKLRKQGRGFRIDYLPMVCFSFFKHDILMTLNDDFNEYFPRSVTSCSSGNVTPFDKNIAPRSLFSSPNFDEVKNLFSNRLKKISYSIHYKSNLLLGHGAVLWPEWIAEKDYVKTFSSFVYGKELDFYEFTLDDEPRKKLIPYYTRCKSWLEKQIENE